MWCWSRVCKDFSCARNTGIICLIILPRIAMWFEQMALVNYSQFLRDLSNLCGIILLSYAVLRAPVWLSLLPECERAGLTHLLVPDNIAVREGEGRRPTRHQLQYPATVIVNKRVRVVGWGWSTQSWRRSLIRQGMSLCCRCSGPVQVSCLHYDTCRFLPCGACMLKFTPNFFCLYDLRRWVCPICVWCDNGP